MTLDAWGWCPKMTLLGSNYLYRASQVVLVVRNPPANAGDVRDASTIPGSGSSPGGRHPHRQQAAHRSTKVPGGRDRAAPRHPPTQPLSAGTCLVVASPVGSALPPTCTPSEKRFKAADYCTLIRGKGLQR